MPRLENGALVISTLADRIAAGQDMSVTCDADVGGRICGHYALLNLEALAERLGGAHSALAGDLARRLRCKACGGRRMRFLVTAHVESDYGHSVTPSVPDDGKGTGRKKRSRR
jgi:hypothetical protein